MIRSFLAVALTVVVRCADAGVVPCHETAVGTEKEKDAYVYDWDRLRYNWHIGAKPFRGPESLSVEVAPVFEGDMVLCLRDMETGSKLLYTSRWERVTTFLTKLPATRRYQFEQLHCRTRQTTLKKGVYEIRRFDGLFLETQAGACRVDVETGNPLHIVRDVAERPVFTLRNPSDRTLTWSGLFTLSDLSGHVIRQKFKGVEVPSGVVYRMNVQWPLPSKGLWTVNAEVRGEDGSVAYSETRFAVLDRHDETPNFAEGKFRMGINYHYGRFSPKDREITLSALVASGAKLARVDMCSRSGIQAKGPNSWEWQGDDEAVEALWGRGIAINAGCWGQPQWAASPGNRTNTNWKVWWTLPPEDLIRCEEFFARMAARYGRKIAYYEIGNEWDLWGFFPGDENDALTALRTAYAGIKRGCPDAVVAPCGWAHWDSSHASVIQKGLAENVMIKGKGCYDVHAIHNHGSFRNYRKAILERFLPRRKAMGITAPWYSNETAVSSAHGNEVFAAENVWQKILFAWAHGSTDYIWYNLIATGWDPKDAEQGYGIMTPDYYPRASFAAFSALTALLSGFDFDRIIGSESAYELYRFKGMRDGRGELVMVGWTAPGADGRTVRIKTDALAAELVDFMGNHAFVPMENGTAVLTLRRRPQAILFRDASYAKAYAKDIAALAAECKEEIGISTGKFDGRAADLVIDKGEFVNCPYDANPTTEQRTWKGVKDGSFSAWFARGEDGALRMRIKVQDDVHVQHAVKPRGMSEGDCIRLTLGVRGDPIDWELGFRLKDDGKSDFCVWSCPGDRTRRELAEKGVALNVRRDGETTVYDIELPKSVFNLPEDLFGGDIRLALKIDDNDGEGRDYWMGMENTFRLIRKDH